MANEHATGATSDAPLILGSLALVVGVGVAVLISRRRNPQRGAERRDARLLKAVARHPLNLELKYGREAVLRAARYAEASGFAASSAGFPSLVRNLLAPSAPRDGRFP